MTEISLIGQTTLGWTDGRPGNQLMPRAGGDHLAGAFAHPGVADAYRHRPPYPPEVFDLLLRIITDRPRTVLDIGAGEGALARPLAARVDHVDAVDISAAMIEVGRHRPGGDQPNLRWIVGAVETVGLGGPYALVTAGASLHWMPWKQTLSRLAPAMTDNAFLAIVEHSHHNVPWRAGLTEVIVRHSRSAGYDPTFSLADALQAEGLFEIAGRATTAPVPFRQPLSAYVEQFHSTASLAREWMSAPEAAAFDAAVTEVARPHAVDGVLGMDIVAHLVWGAPTR
jgi:ubiquinone/menaquinone biosynthesis C-methylase UbiE